jgi:hypothetical protein
MLFSENKFSLNFENISIWDNAHDCKHSCIIFANVLVSYNCSGFSKPCIAMDCGPPILAVELQCKIGGEFATPTRNACLQRRTRAAGEDAAAVS